MQTTLGLILLVISGGLLLGQLISAVNFPLAQKWGLQESEATADPLLRHIEVNAARWDLVAMIWLPVCGLLMIVNHPFWPFLALIAGGASADTGGREAAKLFGLRKAGVRIGGPTEQSLAFGVFAYLVASGLILIGFALADITAPYAVN